MKIKEKTGLKKTKVLEITRRCPKKSMFRVLTQIKLNGKKENRQVPHPRKEKNQLEKVKKKSEISAVAAAVILVAPSVVVKL